MFGSARERYEFFRREARLEPLYGEDRCAMARLVAQLERDGWRCCEDCGEFDVSPEAETDFCEACTSNQAAAKTASQVLRQAAELLTEKGWTQGAYARNAESTGVAPDDPDAVCFCVIGAINRVGGFDSSWSVFALAKSLGVSSVHCWNDTYGRTRDEVVAALLKAADAAEAA